MLLSGHTDNKQNIVLSDKPPITTTMTSLPAPLLESLLSEISTLASVYHKLPSTFVGHGRFGADAIQHAAIQEQRQDAAENPIAAAIAAAANGTPAQAHAENLLDIDFDGSAPASAETRPTNGSNGLEGLAGTPQRVASPSAGQGGAGLDDMMGLFDANGAPPGAGMNGGNGGGDLMGMDGFSSLSVGATMEPPPPQTQLQQQNAAQGGEEDLLGMF